jgi:hypothetical protein
MWQEYAVEPKALSDFAHLKYVVEKFGYAQGRLLSQFPSDWLKQVYEATASLPDVRRKTATVLLQRLKREGLVRFGREYQPTANWLDNALREHGKRPFSALISAEESADPDCIPVDALTDEALAVRLSARVLATAANLCAPMAMLLNTEPELVFVDTYWRFSRQKCRVVLERILYEAKAGKCRKLTFVTRNGDEAESPAEIARLIKLHFGSELDDGFTINVAQIDDQVSADRLHARYLVGRKAGLRYDKGFDEAPGERVEIGIMDAGLHAEIRDLFLERKHPAFALAQTVEVPAPQHQGFRFSRA